MEFENYIKIYKELSKSVNDENEALISEELLKIFYDNAKKTFEFVKDKPKFDEYVKRCVSSYGLEEGMGYAMGFDTHLRKNQIEDINRINEPKTHEDLVNGFDIIFESLAKYGYNTDIGLMLVNYVFGLGDWVGTCLMMKIIKDYFYKTYSKHIRANFNGIMNVYMECLKDKELYTKKFGLDNKLFFDFDRPKEGIIAFMEGYINE